MVSEMRDENPMDQWIIHALELAVDMYSIGDPFAK